jgi:hypothetical protein
MAINESLKTLLLDNNYLNNHQEPNAVIAALNAILDAGYDNSPEATIKFRQALKSHHAFWTPLLRGIGAVPINANVDVNDNVNLLISEGEGVAPNYNNFADLTGLVAYKSAQLSLKQANDNDLEALITQSLDGADNQKIFRQKFFDEQGKSKFLGENIKVKNWDPQANILDSEALPFLQQEAQRQLLIKKINLSTDITKLNALMEKQGQNEFTRAVREIFGLAPVGPVNNVTDGMQEIPVFNSHVRHAAAKKALLLLVENKQLLTDEHVLASSPGLINELDPVVFRNNLEWLGDLANPSAHALHDAPAADYMNLIKGPLGARFIALKAAELGAADIEFMENIASSSDLTITKNLLNTKPELQGIGPDPYTNHAVTDNSLPKIRQAYAAQALKMQIFQCDDVAALDALMQVSNVGDLKRVLSDKVSLKYTGKTTFHEAFTGTTDLNPIIAYAHIRKCLLTGSSEHLKALIVNRASANFRAAYHANFSAGTTPETQTVINRYFSDENNVKKARELALLTFAKSELSKQNDDIILNGLITANSSNEVVLNTGFLLGSHAADDLVNGNYRAGISKELRTYAAIEKIIKDAKAPNQDLSIATGNVTHNALLANINAFTFALPTRANIQALLTAPDFPPKEKQRVEAHLVESLIRNYPLDRIPAPQPPAGNKLTELAKATDLAGFKQQLNEKFGVGNTAWLNEKTMEQVQKNACVRLIELNQNKALKYTSIQFPLASRAHPKLMKLIFNLPLAKQQALLDNPLALSALAAVENKFVSTTQAAQDKSTENKNEIERILGDKNLVSEELIQDAVIESENLNRLSGIANPKIASTLAQMDPQVHITAANVDAINRLLIPGPYTQLNINSTRNIIQEIARDRAPLIQANIYQAFGLQNDGATVATQATINNIISQHTGNQYLIPRYNLHGTSAADKVIILKLITLDKRDTVTANNITNIITDIKEHPSFAEFTKAIKGPPEKDYYADGTTPFDPPLDQQFTAQIYEQIKTDIRKQTLLDPDTYLAELEKQQEEIDAMEAKFSETQLGYFESRKLDRLTQITNITPFYWFNPSFRAVAKKHALQLGEELKELSKLCDNHIIHLNNQLHAIQLQIDSLPGSIPAVNEEIIEAISDRREDLDYLKKDVIAELGRYKAMETVFKDTPGILKMIDEAKDGKKDLHFTNFTSSYEDYPVSERGKHFEAEWTGELKSVAKMDPTGVGTHGVLPELYFESVPALEEKKFREHTLSYKKSDRHREDLGSYIEEHSPTNLEPVIQSDGTVDYPPSVKFIANRIMQSPEGKVTQAMQMACDLVKTLTSPPTAEKPILLLGSSDPEFAKYLWTALMIIGEDKNLKFGKEAIKVVSAHFDPETQLSWKGLSWSNESVYETQFKSHPGLKGMLEGVKDINQKKFGDSKVLEEAAKDTKGLTTSMKDRMFKIIDKDNKEQQESTRPTLGSGGPK